jgi:predicted nucleic acid-binding protein
MSTPHLLDANVLIALTVAEHEHHERASAWIGDVEAFAVSPIVEGALARFLIRLGESPATTSAVLGGVRAHPRFRFWPDSVSYADVDLSGVLGHRTVTDTYLVALAGSHNGRLATLDESLAGRHPDVCVLVTTGQV